MKKLNLNDFIGGWLVGTFQPAIFNTDDVEFAIKEYKAGASEPKHHHKLAKEWTVIIKGKVSMNGEIYKTGDIVEIAEYESVKFDAIEDTITAVVKTPSIKGDKYLD